jgi:teichuronic acid biosynthesis glycosyltransferase TuaH
MPHQFVIFSLSPWNIDYGCNIKDLSMEFAKEHKVLYIDVPLKRKERWLMKDKPLVKEAEQRIKSRKLVEQVGENLWHYMPEEILESVNQVKNNFLFDTINKVNNKRFARTIRKAVKAVGFDNYILLNDNDIYNGMYLQEMVMPHKYVYYLRDNLQAMSYWKVHAGRLEPKLIEKVNGVVANSEYLTKRAKSFNKNSYYVGQGCDVTQFLTRPDQMQIDRMLEGIPRPIAGYVGALNAERLDIQLICDLAKQLPQMSFVLVGKEDKAFQLSELHSIPNVFFTGLKEFSDLPTCVYGFDVALNPQKLNEVTIGNYPRKIDEYLATGVPVVATSTDAMKPFQDHVYLGSTAADYVKLIDLAIKENNQAKALARQKFASEHNWKNNAAAIVNAIENMI